MTENEIYGSGVTVGIIGAMDSELKLLLSYAEEPELETAYGLEFHTGKLNGRKAVIVKAGIGKVNAARCTQLLIDKYHPDVIINTGIAGGIAPGLGIGDIIVADGLLQHDFDVTAFGHAKGYLCTGENDQAPTVFSPDRNVSEALLINAGHVLNSGSVHRGIIATGDRFITGSDGKNELYETFHALAAEMEGCAIAQAASMSGVPFAVIRSISDLADGTAAESYDEFEYEAANKSAATVMRTINML